MLSAVASTFALSGVRAASKPMGAPATIGTLVFSSPTQYSR